MKIGNLRKIINYDVVVTRDVYAFFDIYGKKNPETIHWYHKSIPQAFIFQVHRGLQLSPWLDVLPKIAWVDDG